MSWRWVLSSWDPCYSQDVFNLKKKKEKYGTPPKRKWIPPFFVVAPYQSINNSYHKKLEGETWNKAMQVDITDIRRNNQDSFVVVHWFGRMNCELIAGFQTPFSAMDTVMVGEKAKYIQTIPNHQPN